MALILVAVVAVAGLVILRFSNASGGAVAYQHPGFVCRYDQGYLSCINGTSIEFAPSRIQAINGWWYDCPHIYPYQTNIRCRAAFKR